MSDFFKSIQQGLMEAVEFSEGKSNGSVAHSPANVDVKSVRKNVDMTQEEFASTFGISLGTLRHWERGDRTPTGPALVLLNVLNKEPQAVIRALM